MQMSEKEPLREGIGDLIGIAQDIDGIEARNGGEVIDARHIPILDLGLKGVPHIAA